MAKEPTETLINKISDEIKSKNFLSDYSKLSTDCSMATKFRGMYPTLLEAVCSAFHQSESLS